MTNRSGMAFPKDASSKGHFDHKGRIVQGTEHQRLFVWRHIGRGHFVIEGGGKTQTIRILITEQRTFFKGTVK